MSKIYTQEQALALNLSSDKLMLIRACFTYPDKHRYDERWILKDSPDADLLSDYWWILEGAGIDGLFEESIRLRKDNPMVIRQLELDTK